MSGNTARAGTTSSSTDSGQGSDPLSEAFVAVAVAVEGGSNSVSTQRVEAPVGSAQLHVRRSMHVASSRSRSTQASASGQPAANFIDAPPGVKRKIGYAYQVLQPVAEESNQSVVPAVPIGNVDGSRDIATPQLVAGKTTLVGRKRSATSAASDTGRRAPVSRRLASVADFSPTHFDEPVSDDRILIADVSRPSNIPSPCSHPDIPSPMKIDPEAQEHAGGLGSTSSVFSSPVSQNPLLHRGTSAVAQTPSPSRRRSASLRTQNSNAAWAAAEGLLPIPEGFRASGYVPAPVVGGITYRVRSPQAVTVPARRSASQQASLGRQLFTEYADEGMHGSNLQQPQGSSQQAPFFTQPVAHLHVQRVRHHDPNFMHILTRL